MFCFLDGIIVWRYYLPNLAPFSTHGRVFSVLYEQRTVAHFPLTAQCLVLGKSQSSEGSMVYVFNPITGKPIGTSPRTGTLLPYKVLQSMMLPHTGKEHITGMEVHFQCLFFICLFIYFSILFIHTLQKQVTLLKYCIITFMKNSLNCLL